MNAQFQDIVKNATGASAISLVEEIQSLWSGYGSIDRYKLTDSKFDTVVVKHVKLPVGGSHPRGWNTDRSHERKVKSYEVETAWYDQWNSLCGDKCRTPHCLAMESMDDEVLIVLEDLDGSGFDSRKGSVSMTELKTCLSWLAYFHATYMGKTPGNLWEIGTYWHLDTRPDELRVLEDKPLREAALELDKRLNNAQYISFVHGDAKLANFCFSPDGTKVAAVDFQYVGGGCGMKDVAYFIGSCLYEAECEELEEELLNFYFTELNTALAEVNPQYDASAVETEWRELFPIAWTDFHRFVKGWSPGHWKINGYSEKMARTVVSQLQGKI